MIIKGLTDEDFVQYKKPCMSIIMPTCTFKCEQECGEQVCQNGRLAHAQTFDVSINDVINRYKQNNISQAVCFEGLEPFDSFNDLQEFISLFRQTCSDDIVIYTGYNKDEILDEIAILKQYKNIIVKFGRFVPHQIKHFDCVLGVDLASYNQYAERIS